MNTQTIRIWTDCSIYLIYFEGAKMANHNVEIQGRYVMFKMEYYSGSGKNVEKDDKNVFT